MKYILIIVLTVLVLPVWAQREIKVEDAKDHVGDLVKICTKIFGGKFLMLH